jgi:hypothetical protein
MFCKRPKKNPKIAREIRMARTFWNGEPTLCRRVRVRLDAPIPTAWWCAGMEGTERDAVRIDYHGEVFYIDNQGGDPREPHAFRSGDGWLKVTLGMGGPDYGHAAIRNCTEIGEQPGNRIPGRE